MTQHLHLQPAFAASAHANAQTALDCLAYLQVKFKPNAKRIELSTALDTYGDNYNSRADQSKYLNDLVLKSQLVDLPTSFAIGCVRGDHLILSPLDEAVQMRPHLGHLDTTKKQVKEEEDTGDEEKKPSFITVSICCSHLFKSCVTISGHCIMLHYPKKIGTRVGNPASLAGFLPGHSEHLLAASQV